MAEAQKRLSQTTLKRRQRFHRKRDVRPAVLAKADRLVIRVAAAIGLSFLAIIILQAVLG
ncbi:hypothetical protein AMC90_CH03681 [Rhizobium phaseoli]|uniref:Hypothetical conserved protein n=1 Tax=Rhizobium etli (strain CIAT 652) TaxID=491916 RepID=B3PZ13_RHIE6|nr:hypothetical protein [Rhizobium phaseoli]ACE92677.1 hypothetical conserved protein [Rhizobium etli CIAT 652]ANL29449.1 hypothetical protein AMC90_CH03681 [Rhizobium phaseoli]ANM05815.1 hypothetical protein AMC78_CH03765 [Rhizobium phaseoli]KKZ86814.1 hypothetical protein RPHASCH2410_CH16960 [Rhizobium phaseoli Ch24-10]RDJ06490.1 hypothetical protein B5K04_20190 [Rhizobium phaseoli]